VAIAELLRVLRRVENRCPCRAGLNASEPGAELLRASSRLRVRYGFAVWIPDRGSLLSVPWRPGSDGVQARAVAAESYQLGGTQPSISTRDDRTFQSKCTGRPHLPNHRQTG